MPVRGTVRSGRRAGDVLTTTDPADGAAAVWTEVGADNYVALNAISCPSASLCVAVDNVGNVVSSIDPAEAPWPRGGSPTSTTAAS